MKRALLFLILIVACPAFADRLFTSGFETNDFTTTEWTGTSTTAPTFQTTTVHSGTYAIQAAPSSSVRWVRRQRSAAVTSGTFFMRVYFRCSTFPNTVTELMSTRRTGAGAISMSVRFVNTSNVIRLRNNVTATEQTGSQALSTNTWYRLEARHLLADTGGEMEVRIYEDGNTTPLETLSITNEDTLATDVQDWVFGLVDTTTATCFFDDVAVNDANGTFQNSWTGPGKLFLIEPTSDDTVAWTKTGANCSATTNTDCVDDMPGTPDDLSGYNTIGTSGTADRFNITLGSEIPSDADMILMDLVARFGASGSTGTRLCRVDIWDDGGTQSSGPDTGVGCDGTADTWAMMTTASHLVVDLGTKSKATVASYDIGYTNRSAHSNRVTGLWGYVEWIEAAAPPLGPATLPRVVRW
ncbi:MAG TPA: hypothetical protein VNK82_10075 [Terriglobales bacterium]|nr:hypothetical protein [Terriglobales bacterium]